MNFSLHCYPLPSRTTFLSQGNFLLLRDRYKSLQKRGVIEPRVAVK